MAGIERAEALKRLLAIALVILVAAAACEPLDGVGGSPATSPTSTTASGVPTAASTSTTASGFPIATPTSTASGTATSLPSIPGHLDILSATIRDLPPFESQSAATRQVILSVWVTEAPSCGSADTGLTYGFLIDSDRDPTTGEKDVAFASLGVDARVSAECDPSTGTFFSPLGDVDVGFDPDEQSTRVDIVTTVQLLPSVDFYWIAFAYEEPMLIRVPEAPEIATWAISEIRLF